VGQGEDVALRVELRATGSAEHLVGRRREYQLLLARLALHQRADHDGPGRQVDPGRECLGTNHERHKLAQEERLNDLLVLGQYPRVMHADPSDEHLLELGADAVRQVVLVGRQLRVNLDFLCVADDRQPLEPLGHLPALVAIEAEDQGGHAALCVVVADHLGQQLGNQLVADPDELQRHTPLV